MYLNTETLSGTVKNQFGAVNKDIVVYQIVGMFQAY
jgi:hypothetical protein